MLDVLLLRPFVPCAQEENDRLTDPGEINPVSRSPVDSQFQHPFARCFDVSEIAGGDPCQPCGDPRSGLPVGEPRQPLDEWPLAGSSLIVMNLVDHHCNL